MSLEPKKPIEELLEATARARRAEFGADPKMPNPLRTELHHEITRLSRQAARESRWRSLEISWPRLMTATALALLLVSASVIWWWREREFTGGETMKLAMQEPAREAPAPEKIFEQGAAGAGAAAPSFADSNAAASRPAQESKENHAT